MPTGGKPKRHANGTAKHHLSPTNAAIVCGDEDLSNWDDEEILRGQRRNKRGTWTGRPPLLTPQAVHAERVRRTMIKSHQLLRESTYAAVELLRTVVDDEEASYGFRLQAASLILERTLPKNHNYNLTVGVDREPLFQRLLRNATLELTPGPGLEEYEGEIIDIDGYGQDEITWET